MNAAVIRPSQAPDIRRLSRIVFWEPCVSPHKSAFIDAVAARCGPSVDVLCVAHEDVPRERRALGWNSGAASCASGNGGAPVADEHGASRGVHHRMIVGPSNADIDALVARSGAHCLHVFSGIRWFSTITRALAEVRRRNGTFAIMSEPRDDAGLKGAARIMQSWASEGWLRRNVQFVLAIGRHGPPWFRSVGYGADRVFPFAYFLPPPQADRGGAGASPNRVGRKIEVAYVGRLIEPKGVRHLLPAIAALSRRARLTLIGDGELRDALVQQARASSIDAEFAGVLPIDEVQRRMRDFDVLALPSLTKDDGWGAVVSEALLAGTAAIASSCAGASILLDDPGNGCVVAPGDSEAIARAIADLERRGALTRDARAARMRWASTRLTAQAGASYFMQIVRHRFEGGPRPMEFYR